MFIKYDEYELLELFQNEPVSIADDLDAGELIYLYEDAQKFKLILTMDVYKQICSIDITYNDNTVFSGEFNNVSSIRKIADDIMIIDIEREEKIRIKFSKQVGVELL
ncbi:hypothetical protein [Priestia filamentosa]|uniref:hypothetical protein n=1 Tax=Priestia filamentosa TaxID=1402861 RepID=UPI001C1E7ABB|nr:hypothetical protein [Priestia filamentosa]